MILVYIYIYIHIYMHTQKMLIDDDDYGQFVNYIQTQ